MTRMSVPKTRTKRDSGRRLKMSPEQPVRPVLVPGGLAGAEQTVAPVLSHLWW
jgi:hypothetical protein